MSSSLISLNNNMGSMVAMNGLDAAHDSLSISLARLSTGVRVNLAEDDASAVNIRDHFQADGTLGVPSSVSPGAVNLKAQHQAISRQELVVRSGWSLDAVSKPDVAQGKVVGLCRRDGQHCECD